jgi:hypothetical protein|tara:strand:- start:313 stop:516 length:204 start_codon:yes stop_codon:yes gene_type:complete
MMIIYFLRTMFCLILIALGGVIAVGLENAILGILVSASGVLAIAMPLMIEGDDISNEMNRRYREGKQ